MNENYQNNAKSKLIANETKLWLPPTFANNKVQQMKRGINWGYANKSVWEWLIFLATLLAALGAIAIPFVVTIIGLNFTQQQAQTGLQLAQDQQQEQTLQTYLNDMSDLLLTSTPDLRNTQPGKEIHQVARERTLITLRRLNADRNKIVLQFLQGAHLIGIKDAVIDLSNADLSNDDLSGADLSDINLNGVDLNNAHLSNATLNGATLNGADLSNAHLNDAHLNNAQLNGANLSNDDLSGVTLNGAILSYTFLNGVTLNGADLSSADLNGAFLNKSILNGADLNDADLSNAHLNDAFLNGATLNNATLNGATLSNADLNGARDLTQQQLNEVHSCKNATLSTGLTCYRNQ